MTELGSGVGIDLEDWFTAFHGQSARPAALGELDLTLPRRLGGGRSGATAALFFSTQGPIVLKWDSLEQVVREAEARRGRPDQASNMAMLRERGASHVAIHRAPADDTLLGIMAYPYHGRIGRGLRDDLVGDFAWFLTTKYPSDWGDDALRQVFAMLLKRLGEFPQDDGETAYSARVLDLPDLADWRAKSARAHDALTDVPGGRETLVSWRAWAGGITATDLDRRVFDSRLIHGDPRFANIMVDLDLTRSKVALIDFGAGAAGSHLFRDLARFEVDLLLRSTEPGGRDDELRVRALALLGHGTAEPSAPHAHPAYVWREVRNDCFTAFHKEHVRQVHALFISMELLRRIGWHASLREEADSGATPPELVVALDAVMTAVPT